LAALPPATPTGGREITLPNAIASRLELLSGQYRAPVASSAAIPDESSIVEPSEGEPGGIAVMDWLPWALGGAALLGVGGYFIYRGKKKVKANRRRRRRR
jgi:hypothetical protein